MASFWDENTTKKKKNTEQAHAGLLHHPSTIIATPYASSLDPTDHRQVLQTVVVSYVSSLGLTRRCWALREAILMALHFIDECPPAVRVPVVGFESLALGSNIVLRSSSFGVGGGPPSPSIPLPASRSPHPRLDTLTVASTFSFSSRQTHLPSTFPSSSRQPDPLPAIPHPHLDELTLALISSFSASGTLSSHHRHPQPCW